MRLVLLLNTRKNVQVQLQVNILLWDFRQFSSELQNLSIDFENLAGWLEVDSTVTISFLS